MNDFDPIVDEVRRTKAIFPDIKEQEIRRLPNPAVTEAVAFGEYRVLGLRALV
jgi:hypothetical protein